LQETKLEGIWPDPKGQKRQCPVFHIPPLREPWSRCLEGLPHPHTKKIRPIVFANELAKDRDDVVLVHLAFTSNTMAFAFVPKEIVFSHVIIVISTDASYMFCMLQSNIDTQWARKYGSSE
jgi:hypothetical protein